MYAAWNSATPNRPIASPATIVAGEVGVDAIRRETPSLRVSTSRSDAVIDVRNVNITSWVEAPNVNCVNPANVPGSPIRAHRHHHAGRRRRTRPRPRPAPASNVPAPSACRDPRRRRDRRHPARRGLDRRPQALRQRRRRAQVAQLDRARGRGRAAPPRTRPGSPARPRARRARPSSAAWPRRSRGRTSKRASSARIASTSAAASGSPAGTTTPRRAAVVPPNWRPRATMISVGRTSTKNRSPRSRSWRTRLTRPIASALRTPLIP